MKLTETDKRQIAKNLIDIKDHVLSLYVCNYLANIDTEKTAIQDAYVEFKCWGKNRGSLTVSPKGNKVSDIAVDLGLVFAYETRTVRVRIIDDADMLVKALDSTEAGWYCWYCAFDLLKNWHYGQDIKNNYAVEIAHMRNIYNTIYDFKATEE